MILFSNRDIRALRYAIGLMKAIENQCYNPSTKRTMEMMRHQLIKTRVIVTDSVMQKDLFAMRDRDLVDGYESQLEKQG